MEKIAWGSAGNAWVEAQALLDGMYALFETMLADEVAPGAQVLDVGCGTGATTLAAAKRAGAEGGALGVDISEPMIAAARERAGSGARFLLADAQAHPFEARHFDRLISRFGVMFFDDAVAAFANLHRAMAREGRLHAIVWRRGEDNPFMTEAERAATPLLPGLPVRDLDAPQGQFGFGDPGRVRAILDASGWREATLDPLDVTCSFPAEALPFYLARLGPVGRALEDAAPEFRERVVSAVLPAFDRYVEGDTVRFNAACWTIGALA